MTLRGATAALAAALTVLLALPPVARAAADPVQPNAPRMDFVPPAAGSYVLQRIQRVPDARLLDSRGRSVSLAALTRGKVTLLTFFYTYCTDAWGCPFAYKLMTGLRERLLAAPARAGSVRFVSLSFDPTHDTPDALLRYAGKLASDGPGLEWRFLTARSLPALMPVLDDLGQDVSVQHDERGRPTRALNHMLKLFLIDGDGIVREIYALDYLHPEMMLNDIDTLLMERSGGSAVR